MLGAFSSQLCGTPLFAVGPSSAPSSTSAPTTPSVYTGVGTCNAAYNTTCSALQLSQGYCVGSSGTCGLDVAVKKKKKECCYFECILFVVYAYFVRFYYNNTYIIILFYRD